MQQDTKYQGRGIRQKLLRYKEVKNISWCAHYEQPLLVFYALRISKGSSVRVFCQNLKNSLKYSTGCNIKDLTEEARGPILTAGKHVLHVFQE